MKQNSTGVAQNKTKKKLIINNNSNKTRKQCYYLDKSLNALKFGFAIIVSHRKSIQFHRNHRSIHQKKTISRFPIILYF